MTRRIYILSFFLLLGVWATVAQRARVDVVEIGKENTDLLPKGKEAEGIVGDFILRNNKVHALISGAQPTRRANMRTENNFVTQGCLYDFDLRGEDNDQITAFRPGDFGGEVSWVKVASNGADGVGVIEVVRTAEKGGGLYTRHEYRLEHDWQYILVISTYRNESRAAKKIKPPAVWRGFEDSKEWTVENIHVADSTDPFDKRGYAWGAAPGSAPMDPEATLQPGEEKVYRTALAAADSPLAAYGLVAGLSVPTGEVSGSALDPAGAPAIHANLVVPLGGQELPHYPDAKGQFSFRIPAGAYQVTFQDIGRDTLERPFTVQAKSKTALNLAVSAASIVRGEIRDESGKYSPAKVQFLGVDGTETPDFGTGYRVHGSNHQYQTHDGRFAQQTPPGQYLLRFTRGPEYDLVEQRIEVAKGQTVDVQATLKRTVDTRGWVSTDFHAHSTPSGDNYCATDDRIINIAAEHVEFAPTTEHNRIYDWQPHIERLGLTSYIKTIIGMELTGSGIHMNAFPLKRDPFAQDGGAPVYNYDPRINALVLRNWGTPSEFPGGSRHDTYQNARVGAPHFGGGPDRWVQANHPSVGYFFFDRNRDGVEDGGFVGFDKMIDAAEVWSADILAGSPTIERSFGGRTRKGPNRTFGWLQMLNQGRHVWCVAVSDAHRIFPGGVGGWRTFVPSSTDEPGQIDPSEIIRNAKAGRMMITNGPFLVVTTSDGLPIGSHAMAEETLQLKIRVQTPDWMDIDRVQVMVSGRQPEEYNFTKAKHPAMFKPGVVRFDETVDVKVQRDEHLIVVATGESSDISKGWGRSPVGRMHPVAFTNPIYVDVDRNGFQANGDTLGFPLMTARAGATGDD
jgi:hypothetical protein